MPTLFSKNQPPKRWLRFIRLPACVLAVLVFINVIDTAILRSRLALAQEPTPAATQRASSCQQLLPLIQESIKSSCNNMDRDQVCYAHNSVNVELAEGVDKASFSKVGDVLPMSSIKSLVTAPYSSQSEQWGLAVMKVQAQVPNTTAGQAVTFILYGDAKLQNGSPVQPADSNTDAPGKNEPCKATTTRAVSFLSRPATNFVIQRLPAESEVIAKGQTEDGTWILAQLDQNIGWIKAENLDSDCDLTALPVVDPDKPAVMPALRAFYFSTGISDQAACTDAASGMMIQSPNGGQVSFNLNGADMTIGSSIVIRAVPKKRMTVQVIRGHATIRSHGKTVTVTENHEMEMELGGADGMTVEGEPGEPEEIPQEDAVFIEDACQLAAVAGADNPCDPANAEDNPQVGEDNGSGNGTEDNGNNGDGINDNGNNGGDGESPTDIPDNSSANSGDSGDNSGSGGDVNSPDDNPSGDDGSGGNGSGGGSSDGGGSNSGDDGGSGGGDGS